jgi:hypothetical protein
MATDDLPATTSTTFLSFGHRCTIAQILKDMNLKTESYPFDWSISKLPVVEHCIKDRFRQFMDPTNYVELNTQTVNVIDTEWQIIRHDTSLSNKFYDDPRFLTNRISKYHLQLALTHYDMNVENDRQYFARCIERFNKIFASPCRKVYIYSHMIMGIKDFERKHMSLLIDFSNFNAFIQTQTSNAYGIFLFVVKGHPDCPHIDLLHSTPEYECYVLYVNPAFLDTGAPFGGLKDEDFSREVALIKAVIKGQASLGESPP